MSANSIFCPAANADPLDWVRSMEEINNKSIDIYYFNIISLFKEQVYVNADTKRKNQIRNFK